MDRRAYLIGIIHEALSANAYVHICSELKWDSRLQNRRPGTLAGGTADGPATPRIHGLAPATRAAGSARVSTGQALFGEGRARTTLALWLSYFFTLT